MSAYNLPPGKKTFTLPEVAEISGFSLCSLETACRRGKITHRHFGRQRVMTRAQLEAFLTSTEVEASPTIRAMPAAKAGEIARIQEHEARTLRRLARRAGAA